MKCTYCNQVIYEFLETVLFLFQAKEKTGMPERDFEARESLLTELMENKHIKAIYHFFAAAAFGVVVNSIVHACFKQGE